MLIVLHIRLFLMWYNSGDTRLGIVKLQIIPERCVVYLSLIFKFIIYLICFILGSFTIRKDTLIASAMIHKVFRE